MHRTIAFVAALFAAAPLFAQPASPIPRASFIVTMDGQFAKIDSNKDGFVTKAEAEAFQRSTSAEAAATRARNAFTQLDSDKNGQLSFVEFARLVSAAPAPVNGQAFVGPKDTNRDGKVSLVEHRTATLLNFDRMDSDKDGVVTPAEMKAGGIIK